MQVFGKSATSFDFISDGADTEIIVSDLQNNKTDLKSGQRDMRPFREKNKNSKPIDPLE